MALLNPDQRRSKGGEYSPGGMRPPSAGPRQDGFVPVPTGGSGHGRRAGRQAPTGLWT